jgi:hypothetical protein
MMETKRLVMELALTGALMVSASVAKANAYMELISGETTIQVTGPLGIVNGNIQGVTGNGAVFIGTIGSWSLDIASGGESGTYNVTLIDNINGGGMQTDGLEVIFSSGAFPLSGAYNFGASDSGGNSLPATVSGYYSSSLYTGSGSLGTSLGSWTLPKTFIQSDVNTNIALSGTDYITEKMLFGGTTGPITPQNVTMNATASFTPFVPAVQDGGMTLTMVGATLLGMVGIRSKFGAKRS